MDFFSKNIYNVIEVNNILPSPPEINLDKYMLKFGFSILYENNEHLAPELVDRYFIVQLNHVKRDISGKIIKIMKLAQCSENEFNNKYNFNSDFIKNKKYLNYFCMAKTNYTLNGSYNDENFSYFEYSLSINWTTLIKEKMTYDNNFISKNKLKLIFKYFDYSIDVDDYYNPIRSYENEVFNYIDFNMIKYYNLDFSLYQFADDKDILLTKPNFLTIPMLDSVSEYFFLAYDRNTNLNDYRLLFKYYIRSSNKQTILKRIYKKLPGVMSEISGLASNFLVLIILFNNFYNKFKSKEELINLLLKFKENFNKEESINKKIIDLNDLYKKRFNKSKQNDIKIKKERFDKKRQEDIKKGRISDSGLFKYKNLFDLSGLIDDLDKNSNIQIIKIDDRSKYFSKKKRK